jgi:ATP-dependent metalloprotease
MGIGRVNMLISDENKLLTAYHEGGHALISLLTEGATPLHKVTILPRGGALGFVIFMLNLQTSMVPKDDNMNMTKKSMIASIDVAMGGRAAEDLFVGNNEVQIIINFQISTGCSSDLSKASELAYAYVRQLGMNEGLSLIAF